MEFDGAFIAALIIVTMAGLIFGLTGFGFALISVPVLLLVYDPATVVMLTLLLSMFTCLLVISGTWRVIDTRVVLSMVPGAVVGLVAGTYVLLLVSADVIKILAGFTVVLFSLVMLRGIQPPGMDRRYAPPIAGGISGVLATSTGLSSPPPVILLAARKYARDPFRGSISTYFVVINAIGLGALALQGLLTVDQFLMAGRLLPATLLGAIGGAWIARYVPLGLFRPLTLILLLLTGAMGVITAATGFIP